MNLLAAKKNSGIALIVAMIAIAVLSVLAAAFAFSMKIETRLALNADSEQQMFWLGRAGVETARWVLSEEMRSGYQGYDSLNQIWAGGPGSGGETNSDLAGFSLNNIPMGDGQYSIKIVDTERKMNINAAPPMLLQQAGINPQLMGQLGQLCDVRSRTFEVHVTAQLGSYQREYVALLLRNNPTDIEIVGFWWK